MFPPAASLLLLAFVDILQLAAPAAVPLLNHQIEELFASRPAAHLVERLNSAGVPAGPLLTIPRVFDDPQVRRPDTTRATELLGWEPRTPWRVGLEQTVAWFRRRGLEAG